MPGTVWAEPGAPAKPLLASVDCIASLSSVISTRGMPTSTAAGTGS
jgi:hypothetical protein